MSDLRVALISHEFPPFLVGGIASHCYDLAYSLSKKKVFTTVFCGRSKEKRVEQLNSHLQVVRLPFFNLPPRFLWFQMQNFKTLSKFFKYFDILHGVNPIASAILSRFSRKLGKPFITSIHEAISSDLKAFINLPLSEWSLGDFTLYALGYPLYDLLIGTCLKNSDQIVVCGCSAFKDLKETYPNLKPEKMSIIYNGINFDKFMSSCNTPSENNFSIVFYGRLVSNKGVSYLVKAASILKRDFPDLSLEIFGKGPSKRKIESLVAKLGLGSNVHIRGYAPHAELIAEIRKASVAVFPSLYEVGPFISGLEAMACKKPLVAFDLPYAREFISDMYNGLLATAEDVEDLAEKIRILLSDENLRRKIGQNAYDYVRKKHNWDILVEKYLEIYETCVSS